MMPEKTIYQVHFHLGTNANSSQAGTTSVEQIENSCSGVTVCSWSRGTCRNTIARISGRPASWLRRRSGGSDRSFPRCQLYLPGCSRRNEDAKVVALGVERRDEEARGALVIVQRRADE